MSRVRLALVAILLLGAACSRETRAPLTPDVGVKVHGVLHVSPEGTSGIQGRHTPWLVADDGAAYDLALGPGFEPLSDPSNSGRGVTITGGIGAQKWIPVGAEEPVIGVTAFMFD